ncbi:MAG: UDP-4-amino-4,6-dideoxy-N-acetyl-beta-L-altrosamine transaminase [Thermosulfidibacteraceae bacterium]|jgi:UDP-4-amino-4,6-dideoxy-N-acetyl-beta-L-altrosamine transaminase
MIPYGKQLIDEEDIKAVVEVLRSDFITQGPKVEEFEDLLSQVVGAKYVVAFNSGTSALYCAYRVLGLLEGSEFITTPITFVATISSGVLVGLKPIFCDVEEDTGNLRVDLLESLITEKTKVITPVHYGGHPVDMARLWEIAVRHNLYVIEDACHALGSLYRGERIGSCRFSHMAVFSFHPVKHITTGEGGAIATNDEAIYKELLKCRNHGIKRGNHWYYDVEFPSFNFRITDIQCALGMSQLRKLSWFVSRRREIAERYNKAFRGNLYFDIPIERDYAFNSYHLYPIRLKDKKRRKKVFIALREKGLGVQVHYIPAYWHSYLAKMGYRRGLCPASEDFYERVISIPIYPGMTDRDADFVISKVFEVFESL